MNEVTLKEIKDRLDSELESADPRVGIIFSENLFFEFRKNNWFSLEKFGVLGSKLHEACIPAYKKTHPVILTWDSPGYYFKIGVIELS